MKPGKIRILSRKDIKRALSIDQAITLMRHAFIQLSEGKAISPTRTHMAIPDHDGEALFMPVYLPNTKQMGLKLVTLYKNNPAQNMPFIQAAMIVSDAVTGQPLAMMDGEYLTTLRTGAATGLATDLLANLDAGCVAIFGAGAQARFQLEGICSVRAIERAYVFNRDKEKAKTFCNQMRDILGIDVIAAEKPNLLKNADIICTATSSPTPVFSDEHVKPGAHINAIGAYRPDMREIPGKTVARSLVIVDHLASCLKEAGDLLLPMAQGLFDQDHIHGEIGEVATGAKPGRVSEGQTTLFKSVGNAVQDLAAASQIIANAQTIGLGTVAEL